MPYICSILLPTAREIRASEIAGRNSCLCEHVLLKSNRNPSFVIFSRREPSNQRWKKHLMNPTGCVIALMRLPLARNSFRKIHPISFLAFDCAWRFDFAKPRVITVLASYLKLDCFNVKGDLDNFIATYSHDGFLEEKERTFIACSLRIYKNFYLAEAEQNKASSFKYPLSTGWQSTDWRLRWPHSQNMTLHYMMTNVLLE